MSLSDTQLIKNNNDDNNNDDSDDNADDMVVDSAHEKLSCPSQLMFH